MVHFCECSFYANLKEALKPKPASTPEPKSHSSHRVRRGDSDEKTVTRNSLDGLDPVDLDNLFALTEPRYDV